MSVNPCGRGLPGVRTLLVTYAVYALAVMLFVNGCSVSAPRPQPVDPQPGPRVAEPKAVLEGPAVVPAGTFGLYRCEGALGKTYQWLIFPEEAKAWFVPIIVDKGDGTAIRAGMLMPTKPVPIYLLFIATEGDRSAVAFLSINKDNVPQPQPQPDPGPGPPLPGPTPGPQPDLSNWAKWAKEFAVKLVEAPDAARKASAVKIADALVESCKAVEGIEDDKQARQTMAQKTFDAVTALSLIHI